METKSQANVVLTLPVLAQPGTISALQSEEIDHDGGCEDVSCLQRQQGKGTISLCLNYLWLPFD